MIISNPAKLDSNSVEGIVESSIERKPVAIILGLDPGSRFMGVGVIKVDRDAVEHLYHGVVDASKEASFYARIAKIGISFKQTLEHFRPDVVVIEQIFLGKNADSAFKLGHARGACMYEVAKLGISIREYATRLVKKGVTGNGAADKLQVHRALEKVLQIQIQNGLDASDALALAYHHATQIEIERKLEILARGSRRSQPGVY